MHPFHGYGLSGPRESELIGETLLFVKRETLTATFDFQNCKLLEKMDLEECLLITDATLTHLAMGCPRLEKLVSDSLISMILYMIFLSKTVLAFACSSYSNCVYTMLYFLRAPLTTGMRM